MSKTKKALIVIDVQNYFINSRTKILPQKIKKYIEKNKNKFDLLIFTNFVNTPKSHLYKILGWRDCLRSPEVDIVAGLSPVLKYGYVFSKNVLSVFKVPRALQLIKRNRISEVYLCGIDTDCCVLATAYDAFDDGYKVKVLKKLCVSTGGANLQKSVLAMIKRNVGFIE